MMLFLDLNDDVIIPIIAVFGFSFMILSAFLFYYFSNAQKIIRTLSKLPIKQIGVLKNNEFTRFSGKALNVNQPLIAPFSKRKCVFYIIKIQQKKKGSKKSYWETLVDEEKIQKFFLENNGEFALISPTENPKNYIRHLIFDKTIDSKSLDNSKLEFETLIKHYNLDKKSSYNSNKPLRYSEAIIEVGEQITVAGFAKWKTLTTPIKGYSYSKIAELESSDKQKLIITDLPNIKSKKRV